MKLDEAADFGGATTAKSPLPSCLSLFWWPYLLDLVLTNNWYNLSQMRQGFSAHIFFHLGLEE